MVNHPKRTCIGCRGVFNKGEVVRLVAGPAGLVIDYREKLPGRAAYLCPRRECINKGLTRSALSRALHTTVSCPDVESFIRQLENSCREKIKSLILMAEKAGMAALGYSAARDAVEKKRAAAVVMAEDLSEGTRGKLFDILDPAIPCATCLTKNEIGAFVNRELVGIIAITDKSFSDAIMKETQRLNNLINTGK